MSPDSNVPSIGDRITVEVGDVAHGGHMVARTEGFVIFVRHALPGEIVTAQIVDVRRGFARAEAVEIIRKHPERIEPRCPAFAPFGCGGCDFQHATSALQREMKMTVLREALLRHGGLTPQQVEELTSDGMRTIDSGWHWRSRMRFAVMTQEGGSRCLGMYAHRSDELVATDHCQIAERDVLEAATALVQDSDAGWEAGTEIMAATDGTSTYAAVAAGEAGQAGGADGKTLRHVLEIDGERYEFRVPMGGFWQSQRAMVPHLVEAVVELGRPEPGQQWWDLYAGAGPIAAGLATRVSRTGTVHAVESAREAVLAAREAFAGRPWVQVHRGDVRRWLGSSSSANLPAPSGVVLDPPRSGAGQRTIESIVAREPEVIVYVACDPVALGRDTAYLADRGYRLEDLRAWDAFPQTHHVEAVAAFRAPDRIS